MNIKKTVCGLVLLVIATATAASGQQMRRRAPGSAEPELKELPIVAELLATPKPSAEQMGPFLGAWEGRLEVPNGTSMNLRLVFEVVDGAVRARSEAGNGERRMKSEAAFIRTLGDDELEWGRRNRSGGIFVSRVRLEGSDTLTGVEEFVGIEAPPGIQLPPPNQVHLKRTSN